MSNGIGCKCDAMYEHECTCRVNWNNAPLSDETLLNLKVTAGLTNWYAFARLIEKAHGIVEDK